MLQKPYQCLYMFFIKYIFLCCKKKKGWLHLEISKLYHFLGRDAYVFLHNFVYFFFQWQDLCHRPCQLLTPEVVTILLWRHLICGHRYPVWWVGQFYIHALPGIRTQYLRWNSRLFYPLYQLVGILLYSMKKIIEETSHFVRQSIWHWYKLLKYILYKFIFKEHHSKLKFKKYAYFKLFKEF